MYRTMTSVVHRISVVIRVVSNRHKISMRQIQISSPVWNRIDNIPDMKTFIKNSTSSKTHSKTAAVVGEIQDPHSADDELIRPHSVDPQSELWGRRFFIETYGCQMNVSDTEIVHAVLEGAGLVAAASPEEANVILVNTCAVNIQPGAECSLSPNTSC